MLRIPRLGGNRFPRFDDPRIAGQDLAELSGRTETLRAEINAATQNAETQAAIHSELEVRVAPIAHCL